MNRLHRSLRPAGFTRRAFQRGMTLIELMIAVAIGLFMMLAFVAAFINMKSAFTWQDQLAQLQDNERLALMLITSTVQSAGYFPDPVTSSSTATTNLAQTTTYTTMDAGQSVTGTDGTSPASDTLTVRYISASGDGLTDCTGKSYATGSKQPLVNTFSVDTTTNELRCAVNGGTANAIVSNVKSMTVLYAVDTGTQEFQYLDATNVPSDSWTKIKMVQVTLKFINPFAGQAGQPATIDWVQTVNLMNNV